MKLLSIGLALTAPAQAYLRFGCSTLSVQRIDPVVEPGRIPSAHVHQIIGGVSQVPPHLTASAASNP